MASRLGSIGFAAMGKIPIKAVEICKNRGCDPLILAESMKS